MFVVLPPVFTLGVFGKSVVGEFLVAFLLGDSVKFFVQVLKEEPQEFLGVLFLEA